MQQTADRHARTGLVAGICLMALAMVVPAVTGWDVAVHAFPPLHATWDPRVGWGTIPSLALTAVFVVWLPRWTERLSWRPLILTVFVAGLAWMLALAAVDGLQGWGHILETPNEYLGTARSIHDVPLMLRTYVERIPYDAPLGNWPVHLAGHPPLAVLFFVALVRIGLGSTVAVGLVVSVLAATTAPAVLHTVKVLGAEQAARKAAPFLTIGPAAIWQAVSADAMFAAVAAWGLLALAIASVRRSIAWGVLAGILLGACAFLSYGLLLLGVLALAVLWLGKSWRPLLAAIVGALAPLAVFTAFGFYYWDALPAIHDRYWAGIARDRPDAYWLFGDLAALLFSAGPILAAGVAVLLAKGRKVSGPGHRVVGTLGLAAVATVLVADLSLMSKAEVERIWLPFVPWLLLTTALLPERWRSLGFRSQVVLGLLIEHLLFTGW